MEKFLIIIEKTKTGFSAYSEDYAVATTAKTLSEIKKNIIEALNFYFETLEIDKIITNENLNLTININQFFEYYPFLNIEKLAEIINKKDLEDYKNGKNTNEEDTKKILVQLYKFGQELKTLRF